MTLAYLFGGMYIYRIHLRSRIRLVELPREVSLAQPLEMACILSVDKRLWCLRVDFANAVWVLSKAHQTENAAQFPVAQVLDVVMNFLRLSVVHEVVSAGNEHTCVIDASGKLQCFWRRF